jgi:hypothetical protein
MTEKIDHQRRLHTPNIVLAKSVASKWTTYFIEINYVYTTNKFRANWIVVQTQSKSISKVVTE